MQVSFKFPAWYKIEIRLSRVSPIKNILPDPPSINYIFTKVAFKIPLLTLKRLIWNQHVLVCPMDYKKIDLKQTMNNIFYLIINYF